jgi:streptomycin 6-kinase
MKIHVTREFEARISGTFGSAGSEWLKRLPDTIDEAANRWSIALEQPFQPLSYNYVAPGRFLDGTPVVLKAGVPHREFSCEINSLKHFDGNGIVRLIEADATAGLMLLERIFPGVPAKALSDDDEATRAFSEVALKLHKAPSANHTFPSASDWGKGFARLRGMFGGEAGPFPDQTLNLAEESFADLLESSSDAVLLHGDLHHENILSSERGKWLALDPKGVIGEPEYEVGAWFRNPYPAILEWSDFKRTTLRRLDVLADMLRFDKQRMLAWAFSQAVLAAIWSYEEGLDEWRGLLACADQHRELLSSQQS